MPVSVSPEVMAQLSAALEPIPEQPIEVRVYSDDMLFPGVSFIQGQRIPPFPAGMEDNRPMIAALVVSDRDTVLVGNMKDLPVAWEVFQDRTVPGNWTELDRLLKFLDYTGRLSDAQIKRSPQDVAGESFKDTTRIGSIAPPSERNFPDRAVVRLFASGRPGIIQYDFIMSTEGLNIEEELIAEYRLRF
jgi:hypothetical protein